MPEPAEIQQLENLGQDVLALMIRHDQLRPFINSIITEKTLDQIKTRFNYVLEPLSKNARGYYKPTLIPHEIAPNDVFKINNVSVKTFEQNHGFSKTLGFRILDFAYTTDLVDLPEKSFEALKGVNTWVIGVFSNKPHLTHLHTEKAIDWVNRIGAKKAIFTHMSSDLDFEELNQALPGHIEPAFDGLTIDTASMSK